MLYRPEHFGHFRTLETLQPPRVTRVVAAMVAAAIAVLAVLLVAVPWVQTASGTGQVIALDPHDRVQPITALVPGRVEQWFVGDGSAVKRGDPIAQIVDNDPQLVDRLRAEREQVSAEIAASQQALTTAEIDVGRTRQLFEEGLAARRDWENAQIKVSEHRAKLAAATAKLARADVALSRQSAQLVRAPRDGRIQGINAAATSTLIGAGDVLATFAPDGAVRVVELFIDGRDVVLVRPGRRVRLEFEGWPSIQFSGWPSVAQGLWDGIVRAVDQAVSPNGLFRVLVEQAPDRPAWPGPDHLRLGTKARGWITMETVSLGYEIWRQLNDFPLEFGPPVAAAAKGKAPKAEKTGGEEAK